MLLIAAALQEELKVALARCRGLQKKNCHGVEFWLATGKGQTICFLKTGVGPRKSAERMERALAIMDISEILALGYGGALDAQLKIGTLVVIRQAFACSIDRDNPAVEHIRLDRSFELAPSDTLVQAAESMLLPVCSGDALTSRHVWGNPEHKRFLREKFGASVVDMETASLAGVSEAHNIPFRCIRVVSDEADDAFLEPFSYDPAVGIPKRAGQLIGKGNMVRAFREWKHNASRARNSLSRFLAGYL